MDFEGFKSEYINQLDEVLRNIDHDDFEKFVSLITDDYENGRMIFVIGNGGSAACATHWVCDFNKGVNVDGSPRAKVVSLSDNTGIVSAIGNDITYDDIFSYQLSNFASEGDLVIALSVSGKSPNLLNGMKMAKTKGCHTASVIGDYDGKLKELSDVCIIIPSKNYGVVEDIHLIINHIITQYLKGRNMERLS